MPKQSFPESRTFDQKTMTSTYRAHLQAKVEETDVFQEITYQGPRWSKLPKPTDAQAAWNRAAAK